MKWEHLGRSNNVEDLRGGGGGGMRVGGAGVSLGGVVLALIAGWIFSRKPSFGNSSHEIQSSTRAWHFLSGDHMSRTCG